jgi:hypothetical protein
VILQGKRVGRKVRLLAAAALPIGVGLTAFAGMAGANHDLLQHVSIGEAKDGGNPAIFDEVSADGSRVFFSTTDSLVSADADSSQDIYERSGTTTTLVSAGQINGYGAFTDSNTQLTLPTIVLV